MPNVRRVHPGELLAVDSSAIGRGADGFFLMLGPPSPETSRHPIHGNVALVHVRGTLEHHDDTGADSYEAIYRRVQAAMRGDDADSPPDIVALCIDSRGGVVSGLNEHVEALRKLQDETGVPMVSFINEMSASAAYAIACSSNLGIYGPKSAIIGSVGTISTMVSMKKQDEAQGVDVRLLTSGERKADGHIHGPITDAAVRAEQARVDKLALDFFKLVHRARGLSVKTVRGLEAAIYLCPDAVKAGLCDGVMSLDQLLAQVTKDYPTTTMSVPVGKGNETDRKADADRKAKKPGPVESQAAQLDTGGTTVPNSAAAADGPAAPKKDPQMLAIAALIEQTEAALSAATDPKKKARLERDLAAYKFTLLKAEGGDDEGEGEDDEDDSKSAAAHKMAERKAKAAEAAKHRANAAKHRAKAAEYEEEARKCESEDDEEDDEDDEDDDDAAAASLSEGARAALTSQQKIIAEQEKRLAAIEKDKEESEKRLTIEAALSARKISPAEAKELRVKSSAFVSDFLSMRKKPILFSDEQELSAPSGQANADLPSAVVKSIEDTIAKTMSGVSGLDKAGMAKLETELRDNLIATHRKRIASANGAGGRI